MTFVRRFSPIFAVLLLVLITPKPAAAATITFTSGPPPSSVMAYEPLSHTFTATGDTTIDFTLKSGATPSGVALSTAGVLSGTPTVPGTSNFTVRAVGQPSGAFADLDVTIVVKAPTITFTSPPVPTFYVNQPNMHMFTASGGATPITFVLVTGSFPSGVALGASTGELSGTPTVTGTYNAVIKAADKHGFTSEPYTVSLTVAVPAAAFTSGAPPSGTVGKAYSFAFTATGDSNIQFAGSGGSLPPGLTLAPSGVLSGTPTAAGSYIFTVKATGTATSATQEVTVVIAAALPVTGTNVTVIVSVAAGVLIIGGLLVLFARKRRSPIER